MSDEDELHEQFNACLQLIEHNWAIIRQAIARIGRLEDRWDVRHLTDSLNLDDSPSEVQRTDEVMPTDEVQMHNDNDGTIAPTAIITGDIRPTSTLDGDALP